MQDTIDFDDLNTGDKAPLGHEGVTIDRLDRIYIVNVEGGGNSNGPRLRVHVPVPEASTRAMLASGPGLIGWTLRPRGAT